MYKVAILAGGLGTRLAEETVVKPKPMVLIGDQPILWHIMRLYASFGFKEFLVALGYKGDVVKDYFINYYHRMHSCSVSLSNGGVTPHQSEDKIDWIVHLLDTGLETQTGGRIKRLYDFVGKERLLLTYGDGLSNVNIKSLLKFHQEHGKLATVTAVRPPARFGSIVFGTGNTISFQEKVQAGEGWINGGFFVLEPEVTEYLSGDDSIWEREPMEALAAEKQLVAFKHEGFWQCMDTLRDVRFLNQLWESGNPPWSVK